MGRLVSGAARSSVPVAGGRELLSEDECVVDKDAACSFHSDGLEATWPGVIRMIEEPQESSVDVITSATPPIIVACTTARSALSAKNIMNTKIAIALKNSTIHSGSGITPSAP